MLFVGGREISVVQPKGNNSTSVLQGVAPRRVALIFLPGLMSGHLPLKELQIISTVIVRLRQAALTIVRPRLKNN